MSDFPTYAPPDYMQMSDAASRGFNPLADLANRSQSVDAKMAASRQSMAARLQALVAPQGGGGPSRPVASGYDLASSPEYMNALKRAALGDHQAIATYFGNLYGVGSAS